MMGEENTACEKTSQCKADVPKGALAVDNDAMKSLENQLLQAKKEVLILRHLNVVFNSNSRLRVWEESITSCQVRLCRHRRNW